jgi:hypothetical protein
MEAYTKDGYYQRFKLHSLQYLIADRHGGYFSTTDSCRGRERRGTTDECSCSGLLFSVTFQRRRFIAGIVAAARRANVGSAVRVMSMRRWRHWTGSDSSRSKMRLQGGQRVTIRQAPNVIVDCIKFHGLATAPSAGAATVRDKLTHGRHDSAVMGAQEVFLLQSVHFRSNGGIRLRSIISNKSSQCVGDGLEHFVRLGTVARKLVDRTQALIGQRFFDVLLNGSCVIDCFHGPATGAGHFNAIVGGNGTGSWLGFVCVSDLAHRAMGNCRS